MCLVVLVQENSYHNLSLSLITMTETSDDFSNFYFFHFTGKEYEVRAKCVVNATGPYTDFVRTMDNPSTATICQPSSGVHITLPGYYSPANMGLLDPATKDGRIIFFLPWQGSTIAGTTDTSCEITDNPRPTEKEIQFILGEIRNYLMPDVQGEAKKNFSSADSKFLLFNSSKYCRCSHKRENG